VPRPTTERDGIARRIDSRGIVTIGALPGEFTDCKYPGEPRWKLSAQWIEFECGCVAERCTELVHPKPFDPVIFADLPEQAVYDSVCHAHLAWMNSYRMRYGGFVDFDQWKRYRRARLMGRVN
jgi:hypothetical protein